MADEVKKEEPKTEKTAVPRDNVTITATQETGDALVTKCWFHTPTILAAIEKAPAMSKIKIDIEDQGAETRTLLEAERDEAVKQVKTSIVPAEHLDKELRKFAQFILEHSSLRGIAVSLVCVDKDDSDAVAGFVMTAPNCTQGQAAALVNCSEANVNGFVTKAKIEIPGRNAPKMGGLIIPTAEDKEKLGIK